MSKAQDKISNKKKELESNLSRIQEDLDRSIDEVKEEVAESISPQQIIKKYPLPIVGASLVLGFLLGSKGSNSNNRTISTGVRKSSDGIISMLGNSLKKRLTQKAIDAALDLIEEKVSDNKKH